MFAVRYGLTLHAECVVGLHSAPALERTGRGAMATDGFARSHRARGVTAPTSPGRPRARLVADPARHRGAVSDQPPVRAPERSALSAPWDASLRRRLGHRRHGPDAGHPARWDRSLGPGDDLADRRPAH